MTESFDLGRFVRAQAGLYPAALEEIRAGKKRSHWMWFVFPQIFDLGLSENSQIFEISGADEAIAYLEHTLLGYRLRECTDAMLGWVGKRGATDILGPVDTLKFRSCMTLFEAIAPQDTRFTEALDGFSDGKRDTATLDRLKS